MGVWYLGLAVSLILILVGIYIHWSVVLAGLLLPFVPLISVLLGRHRQRADGGKAGEASQYLSSRSNDRGENPASGD